MTRCRVVAALAVLALSHAPALARTPAEALDAAVEAGMRRTGAKGLAMAVIEDGRPVVVRTYGVRGAAGHPLNPTTVMYGASLTKAVFAYVVMSLVDEGRLDLDKPLADYLPKPIPDYGDLRAYGPWGDLAGDPRWRRITARMALTHSTGFANFAWLEPDGKLRIHFDPGTRYAYSGAGLMLLQFAIEQRLGLSFAAEAQRRVFDRFAMADTSLTWREPASKDVADGWTATGEVTPHNHASRVRAAGSMDTTLADFARFAAGFAQGEGLSAEARAQMVRGQLPITTASQFPTLQAEAPPAARLPGLAAGLGVVAFRGPQGPGFYKGGHDEQTANTWVCVERRRRCVVILSNDVRAEAMFPELVRTALGETGAPWRWEYPEQVAAAARP